MNIWIMNMIILGSIIACMLFIIALYDKCCRKLYDENDELKAELNKLSDENNNLKSDLEKLTGECYSDEESEAITKELLDNKEAISKLEKEVSMYKGMLDDNIRIKETVVELKKIKKNKKAYKRTKIVAQSEIEDEVDYVETVLNEFNNNPEEETVVLTASPRGVSTNFKADDDAIVSKLLEIGVDVGHETPDGSKITIINTKNLEVIDTYNGEK